MKLKTTNPVTIVQARQFEDEQGLHGVKKLNIFSQEDCNWMLEVGSPTIRQGFSANIKWHQLQEYDAGEGVISEMPVLMFSENFALDEQQLDQLFNAVGMSIVPHDSLSEKFGELVLLGIFHWVGSIRQVFGLDESGFEEVVD